MTTSVDLNPENQSRVNKNSNPVRLGRKLTMKRILHTPGQIIRKLKTADQLLVQG